VQQQNRLRRLMEYRGYENRRCIRVWVREHLAIIDALKANKLGQASQLMTLNLEKRSAPPQNCDRRKSSATAVTDGASAAGGPTPPD
jgi:DNA-binding GntR family transcriptional regulator